MMLLVLRLCAMFSKTVVVPMFWLMPNLLQNASLVQIFVFSFGLDGRVSLTIAPFSVVLTLSLVVPSLIV
jgi:hypothetical protein